MEPIENVENVSKERLRLICTFCKKKEGACIQCSHGHCAVSFHPLCAKEAGCRMEVNGNHPHELFRLDSSKLVLLIEQVSSFSTNLEEVEMKAYCLKHSRLRPRVRPGSMDTPVLLDGSPLPPSLNMTSPISPSITDNNAAAEGSEPNLRTGDSFPEGNAANPIPDGDQPPQGSGESMLQGCVTNSKTGLFDKTNTDLSALLQTPPPPPPPRRPSASANESLGGQFRINSALMATALTSLKKSDILQREVAKRYGTDLEDMLKCMKRCIGNVPKSMAISYLVLQRNETSKVEDKQQQQEEDVAQEETNNDKSPEGKARIEFHG